MFVGCFGGEPAIYGEVMREFVERNLKDLDEVYFVIGTSVPAGTEEWKVRRERSGSFFFSLTGWFIFYLERTVEEVSRLSKGVK